MLTEDQLLELIKKALENPPEQIDREEDLGQLGLDSIRFISLIVMIEEETGREVDDELLLLERMNTVQKIMAALGEEQNANTVIESAG